MQPKLVLSMGDPAGIGPEIIVRALGSRAGNKSARVLVIGDPGVLKKAACLCRIRKTVSEYASLEEAWNAPSGVIPVLSIYPLRRAVISGRWTPETGRASLAAVCLAAGLVAQGQADALVTAPICKEAWHAAGVRVPGHTELLAALTGCREYAMMFVGGPFRLVLVTIHEPLARVPKMITSNRIVKITALGIRELQNRFGIRHPRVAVAGLNPHASEGGLFGREEARSIAPAIRQLKRMHGNRVEGPFPPDTLFAEALKGRWDLVVCMYHDQGLIPFKMLAMHTGVNVTAGLPIIRTSPDHGTAFDIAGTGRADPGSMQAAIRTAADMVRHSKKK